MNCKIDFDESTHTYRLNSIPVPSVTQVISETTGTAWKAAQWYLDRGRAIHKCAEFITQKKEFKFDPRLAGYVAALKRFFAEVKPELFPNCSEMRVVSVKNMFAGTLDLACRIGTRNIIIDFKHSVDKIRIPLQLAGYSIAISEQSTKNFDFGVGVQIKESGEYSMTEIIDLRRDRYRFLALLTTYRIKESCNQLSSQKKIDA